MEPVRNLIPANTKEIGFIGDADLPGGKVTFDYITSYNLTQYALAPLIVRQGANYSWVVANFMSPGFDDWLKSTLGPYEMTDLGFRIYLIHREQK